MRGRLGSIGAAVTLWQVVLAVREHWLSIPPARRARATELVMQSRLNPSSLSTAQRAELRALLGEMRLVELGRRLAPIAAKRRGSGRRRR